MNNLVIFDLDETIIDGQSQFLFLIFLYKYKYIGLLYYLKILLWFIFYKFNLIKDPKPVMEYAFSFVKNKKTEEIEGITNIFFESVLSKRIYPGVKKIITNHLNEGRKVILISNAADVLVKKTASFLNIQYYISTKLEIKNNLYTGKILGDIMYGNNKVKALKEFIVTNVFVGDSWGYSDHHSDLPLLYGVSYPNVVNPTKKLRKIAIEKKWPILKFDL